MSTIPCPIISVNPQTICISRLIKSKHIPWTRRPDADIASGLLDIELAGVEVGISAGIETQTGVGAAGAETEGAAGVGGGDVVAAVAGKLHFGSAAHHGDVAEGSGEKGGGVDAVCRSGRLSDIKSVIRGTEAIPISC